MSRTVMAGIGTMAASVFLGGASAAVGAGAVELVESGTPKAVIVLAASPTRVAEFAALELQHHIRLTTGATLPVVKADRLPERTWILVGAHPEAERMGVDPSALAFEEYVVRFVAPAGVILAGRDCPDTGDIVYDMADLASAKGWPGFWDERGTLHAVYDFLERFCGVLWLNQTELGTVVAVSDTLEVSGRDLRRAPAFRYRDALAALGDSPQRYDEYVNLWPWYAPELDEWAAAAYPSLREQYPNDQRFLAARGNMARLFCLRRRNGGEICRCNHSLYGYYDRFWEKSPGRPELFVGRRPGMFAKGYEGKPPQLCYTSPELIQQVAQDARDYYDGKSSGAEQGIFWRPALPNLFPVEPMDNSSFCTCARCQAFFGEDTAGKGLYSKGTHSGYFFNFVNEVAKELGTTHPGRKVVTLAYMTHAYLPDFAMEPNVAVQFCFTANRAPYSPNYAHEMDILRAWAEKGGERPLYLWLYYTFPRERAVNGKYRCFPGFFAHTIEDQFRLFRRYGVLGMFHCGYGQEVEAYVTFKMMDDPSLDVDDLLDQYFNGLYGRAARPLKKLYLEIEKTFSDPKLRPKERVSGPELNWGCLGTEERMDRYGKLVARARELASTERERGNLGLFEKAVWQYMVAGREQYTTRMSAPIPSLTAPRVAAAGGDTSRVQWQHAADMGGTWFQRGGDKPSPRRFGGRLAHDGGFLYIELSDPCDTSKLETSSMVFPFDDWEVFLAGQRAVPYRQYAVSPTGLLASLSHGEVNFRMNVKMPNPGVRATSDTSAPDRWVVRMAIPFEGGLPEAMRPGETVFLNVLRVSSPGVSGESPYGLDTWVAFCTVHEVDRLAAVRLAP